MIKKFIYIILSFVYLSKIFSIDIADLEKMLNEDVSKHVEYLNSLNNIVIDELNLEREKNGLYPDSSKISTDIGGDLLEDGFEFSTSFGLNYKIFNRDTRKSIVEKESQIYLSEIDSKITSVNLKYRFLTIISNYIFLKKQYENALEDYNTIYEYTEKIKQQFRGSAISKSSLDYAEAILLKDEAILKDAEYAVSEVLETYFKETGRMLDDTFDSIEFTDIYDAQFEDVILIDYTLIRSKTVIDSYKKSIENTNSNTYPELTLSGGLGYSYNDEHSFDWSLGLDVSIPFYSRNYDKNDKEELRLLIENEENSISRIISEKKSALRGIKEKLDFIKFKIDKYNKALVLSENSLRLIMIEADAGVRTVFDVINAQQSISLIKKDIINSEYELLASEIEYYYLTGELIEKD